MLPEYGVRAWPAPRTPMNSVVVMGEPAALRISVLGPLRAADPGGGDITPDGDLQRRLLALLVLKRGHVVSVDDAVDALWPRRVPADPAAALQTHVFRLRRALPDGFVASSGAGYRVEAAHVDLDAERLARAVTDAGPLVATDPTAAAELLTAALGEWRGAPYPELADTDAGRAEAGASTSCASAPSRSAPTRSCGPAPATTSSATSPPSSTSSRCGNGLASC